MTSAPRKRRDDAPPARTLTASQQPLGRQDVITQPLPTAFDPDHYTPRLLALCSNALILAQSQAFRQQFGMGTNEWRVLAALAASPGQSAKEISDSLSISKGLMSPSVNALAARGLLVLVDGPRGSRPMYLTEEGARAYDTMAPIARRGQELIERLLPPPEVDALNALLVRVTEQARRLNEAAEEHE